MRERPIIFSRPMVVALLADAKTQTRRAVQSPARTMQKEGLKVIQHREPGDPWYKDHVWSMRGPTGVWGDYTHERFMSMCPYGQPGDRLWVRETWCPRSNGTLPIEKAQRPFYRAGDGSADMAKPDGWRWRPSIHMPRWASRITLEVTSVRVERLKCITKDDAIAEGAHAVHGAVGAYGDGPRWSMDRPHPIVALGREEGPRHCLGSPQMAFANLWNRIHGAGAWDLDPWVWVVGFRRASA